ncbi:interferon-inducible GTPase 5-like [Mercenaria mercenaria]|uniref:interferon-inducible GTPase 5-like n=1 Tax=Mercenaria mercenaria TaxID=6596 RepID=UPI001E1DF734|nr:interferon-inducible GTPase 5-like [Mercenaria mercenaria]XP_053389794.1 interferon-inducible GTPase 5-like [Mercenaria mercenaria]XP_053389802.1 interferon-inducible GTPase 5-like [Mercenaria mercenaria]XP_053389807.1 interferon-inducible GTPase 5-like [Mercenaria mercenaria]XP_053389814.1 interferon-inducible GTPase 5-like [Mercenaria mercenaria]XP_053389821.1 interferon-inducible GTPase 5-like [Mercenaria mercenaria]XP_053389826.1 interferon-inducible GTPase 5-like [Mercenaria mercenari
MAGPGSSENSNVPVYEEEQFVTAFRDHGIAGIQRYASERLDAWRHIPLDIAVTGQSGAGKSSYINAVRRLKVGQEGAAYTDVKEATKEIRSYKHPSNKNIVFWDLPGVGTENFKRENYLDKVNLKKYDFFIILSSERFSENDGWLAKEIKQMGKRFYFVRTKVFVDIYTEPLSRETPRQREEILDTILIDCIENLSKHELPDSDVYLIDNFKPDDFDFNNLQAKIIEDAPQLKREAIAFSLSGRTDKIIEQKKKELERRIPMIAIASAVAGAVPIPGLGTSVDVALLVKETWFYKEQFGLTDEAIQKSAQMLGMREEELKQKLDLKTFLINCTTKGIIVFCREMAVKEVAAEAVKFIIPIIGSVVSGALSYKTTSYCLRNILEEMYQDSVKINTKFSTHLAQATAV